ncbi:hypothetical protein D3C87_1897170 [compost metagenome]
MFVKAGIGNPGGDLLDDVDGCREEEAVDRPGAYPELPPTQEHDQKHDLDDANINGLHSFSPLRRAKTPIYRDIGS